MYWAMTIAANSPPQPVGYSVSWCAPESSRLSRPDFILPLGIRVYLGHSLLQREAVEEVFRYFLENIPRVMNVKPHVVLNALRNTRLFVSPCTLGYHRHGTKRWEILDGFNAGPDTYVYDRGFIFPAHDTPIIHEWIHRVFRSATRFWYVDKDFTEAWVRRIVATLQRERLEAERAAR
jgi:hypothetical protein